MTQKTRISLLRSSARDRLFLLLAPATVAVALAATGCGNAVPPDGVAKVGDAVIKKAEFDHWLTAAARGQQPPGAGAPPSPPDPPNFEKCVAAKLKQPVPKGSQKPKPEQLKEQCKQEYEGLKTQVLQFLIQAETLQQEAAERDINVSDAEVRKQFADQKKQSFPSDKDYREFLKNSGMTEPDLLFRVKLDVLSNKLREKIIAGKGKVTEEASRKYYGENKARFSQPERRDLAVVLTKGKAKADQARQALEDGQPFKRVARRFSIDEATKAQGGKLPGVAKGQQEKAFDEAIFKAKKGELVGPIKTQFGYYVFKVTKVTVATQQTFEQARQTITGLLKSQQEQKALEDFIKVFQEKYKEETVCAEGFVIESCKNAPEKAETGPASGGAPQGGPGAPQGTPPPGAPQGGPPQGAPPPGAPPQGAPPQGPPPQGPPPGG